MRSGKLKALLGNMKSAQITLILIGLVVIAASACSKDNSTVPLMTCEISRQVGDCTSIPTLNKGKLRILQDGHFTLNGQYNACFHEESVIIHGKYRGTHYNNGMRIELLATKIKGLKSSKSSEFPSTVAVVTLNKSSLKGVISDIWATIRSPLQSNDKNEVEITCKAD